MHRPFNAAAVRLQDFNLAAIVYILDDVDMLGLALSKEGISSAPVTVERRDSPGAPRPFA
jgi:hypothetical protein